MQQACNCWHRRLVDALSAVGRWKSLVLLRAWPDTRSSRALERSEFWKHECNRSVMQADKPTRNAPRPSDWKLLAEQARVEMDPEKLLNLVAEPNRILEEQQSTPVAANLVEIESLMKIDQDKDIQ